MAARGMTLVELSAKVDVTVANLSILKNGHARAVRFTTLTAICDALGCSPGELLSLRNEPASDP
jgi:putative transcriptional regulator